MEKRLESLFWKTAQKRGERNYLPELSLEARSVAMGREIWLLAHSPTGKAHVPGNALWYC